MIRSALDIAIEKAAVVDEDRFRPPEPVTLSEDEVVEITARGRCEHCAHLEVFHWYDEGWRGCDYRDCECER